MDSESDAILREPDWEWHSAAEDVGHADLIRESVDGPVGEDPD
jgi:hypothetical protein